MIINMEFTLWSIILLSVIFLLAYSYLSRSPWRRLPPGPLPFPVIGSIPYLGGDIRQAFAKLADKYGDVFMVYMGSRRAVVLNSYDAIREALLKTPRAFDGRTDMFKDVNNGAGIIGTDGEGWKLQRTFILHSLRHFGLGDRSLSQLVLDEAQQLMVQLQGMSGPQPCHPQTTIRQAVANIISVVVFGERFEYDDPEFVEFLAESEQITIIGANNPALVFNWLKYLPGDKFRIHELKAMTQKWYRSWEPKIEARRERISRGEEVPDDLISLFLKQIPSWQHHADDRVFGEHLLQTMSDLFAAGTDTSSHTLEWALLYLVLDPDVQVKVQAEIEAVIGSDRDPSLQDRQHMPYTEAVLSEVQRLGDLVPLSLPHCTLEDTELRGFTIPKGTMVLPNLNSVHWNPELWPQPHKFDPRRFLSDDGKYRKREHLIPFSLGKRACLGEQLAKMELFLFFTCLLQKFTFSLPENSPRPTTEGIAGITHHARHFDLIVTVR